MAADPRRMARYRLLALASVAAVGLGGAGAVMWFAAGGLSGATLAVLGVVAAFVLVLAALGRRGLRRTSTPYW